MRESASKIKWEKFKIRIRIAYNILFKYKHWVIMPLTTEQICDFFSDKEVEFTFIKHGLQNYNVHTIIRGIAAQTDDIDMMLMKADFEAIAIKERDN